MNNNTNIVTGNPVVPVERRFWLFSLARHWNALIEEHGANFQESRLMNRLHAIGAHASRADVAEALALEEKTAPTAVRGVNAKDAAASLGVSLEQFEAWMKSPEENMPPVEAIGKSAGGNVVYYDAIDLDNFRSWYRRAYGMDK